MVHLRLTQRQLKTYTMYVEKKNSKYFDAKYVYYIATFVVSKL